MRRASIFLVSIMVFVAVPLGAGAVPAGTAPAPETHVGAFEEYFMPSSPQVPRGGTVVFDFDMARESHTATDDSGLDLYDSGLVHPGGPSTSFTLVAAGVYPFVCTVHAGMGGRIRVPMRVSPGRGRRGHTFVLTWASVEAPAGHAYDVQIRRPGSVWATLWSATTTRSAGFAPHVRGTFRFRSRFRDTTTGATSDWSEPVGMKVV